MSNRIFCYLLLLPVLLCASAAMAQQFIPFQRNGLWGLVERDMANGVVVPKYTSMKPLGNGYFQVTNGDTHIIILDSTGKETVNLPNAPITFIGDGLFIYTGKTGKDWYHVSGRKLDIDKAVVKYAWLSSEGKLIYRDPAEQDGFMNGNGRIVIKSSYAHVFGFYKNYSIVSNGVQCGAIDTLGRVVIPVEYERVQQLGNDLFAVYKNGKAALADHKHRLLTSFSFEQMGGFSDGVSCVVKNGSSEYIGLQGKNEIPGQWENASGFKNGVAIVNNGKNDLLINRKGEILYTVPDRYTVEGTDEGIFFALEDKETHTFLLVNRNGQPLFTGMRKWPHGANRSYSVVEQDGKYGLINETGRLVIPLQYNNLVYEPLLDAWFAESYGYIDQQGQKYWMVN